MYNDSDRGFKQSDDGYAFRDLNISPNGIANSENTTEFGMPDHIDDNFVRPFKARASSFRKIDEPKSQQSNSKRKSAMGNYQNPNQSPFFGNKFFKNWDKRMSKMTQEEVRSISQMNYTPSQNTSNNDSLPITPKNCRIKSAMGLFRTYHAEEVSNMSESLKIPKSTRNIHNPLKINLTKSNHERPASQTRGGDSDASVHHLTPVVSNFRKLKPTKPLDEGSVSISSVSKISNDKSRNERSELSDKKDASLPSINKVHNNLLKLI